MIDYLEQLKVLALTALFNPMFLGLLLLLFFMGKFFGKLTRRLNIWKILLLGYFGLFLYAPVRDAGPILGGIFVLGMASNHVGTFFSALSWARNLGDMIFAFRYRSAFEDIRKRERELEERERKLKEAERQQAYRQKDQGQRARSGWRQEAKGFRKKPEDAKHESASGTSQNGSSGAQGSSSQQRMRREASTPQNDLRARHLQTLGLKSGRNYNPDEIKAAYRKAVKKAHPDAGGSAVKFIAVQNALEWLQTSA